MPWCGPKLQALLPGSCPGARTYPLYPAPVPKVQTFCRMSCPGVNVNFMPCCQISWTVPRPIPHAPSQSLKSKPLLAQHVTPFYSIQQIYSATLRRSNLFMYLFNIHRDAPTFRRSKLFLHLFNIHSDAPTFRSSNCMRFTHIFSDAPTLNMNSDAPN